MILIIDCTEDCRGMSQGDAERMMCRDGEREKAIIIIFFLERLWHKT